MADPTQKIVLAVLRALLILSAFASVSSLFQFRLLTLFSRGSAMLPGLGIIEALMSLVWLVVLWGTLDLLRRKSEGRQLLQWSVGIQTVLALLEVLASIPMWPMVFATLWESHTSALQKGMLLKQTPLPYVAGALAGIAVLFFLRSDALTGWLSGPPPATAARAGARRPTRLFVTPVLLVVFVLALAATGVFMVTPAGSQTFMADSMWLLFLTMAGSMWLLFLTPVLIPAMLLFIILRTMIRPLAPAEINVSPRALKVLQVSLIVVVIVLLAGSLVSPGVPLNALVPGVVLFLLFKERLRLYGIALAGGLGLLWVGNVLAIPLLVLYSFTGYAMRAHSESGVGILVGIPFSILWAGMGIVPSIFALIALVIGYRTFMKDQPTTPRTA